MENNDQERAWDILKEHRKEINKLDDQILKLLGQRFKVVRKVAQVKIKHKLPSFLHDRVEDVRNRAVKIGKKHGLDESFTHMLYSMFIYKSCGDEDAIMTKKAAAKTKRKLLSKKK